MDLPKLSLGQDILSHFNDALNKEWLITNGLGGYASSSVLGINTRKYHGLLVASFNPPVTRWVLLSKLDETIQIGSKKYDLGSNEFRDVIYPHGYRHISNFVIDPFPTIRYEVQGVSLKKTVFMPYMKNATVVLYTINNPLNEEVKICISPLINSRHIYDTLDKGRIEWKFVQKHIKNKVIIEPSEKFSSLILSSSMDGFFVEESWWIEKLFFRIDDSRGENSIEDNFRPGHFEFSIGPKENKKFYILATAGRNRKESEANFSLISEKISDIEKLYFEELERRKSLLRLFQKRNTSLQLKDWLKWLVQGADSFIVHRASTGKKSVLAGYDWFDDWGRDALISLPGLTLVTGRFEDAKEILLTFERYCSKGVIPNRFSDRAGDIPLYNTVDASLWFFNAVLQYIKYTDDFDFVQKMLWKTLNEIIESHIQGTIFGIHMDDDGLIAHGPQLTWMDACTTDGFVTPRDGKAVEIQALWFNALKIMELLANIFKNDDKMETYSRLAKKAKESFQDEFWSQEHKYLYDVINNNESDSSLRPNQLMAISLDFSLLDQAKSEQIIEIVQKKLWGEYGLRTLPKTDPRYVGRYIGDWKHRDNAYHNGTVWPWLLGPFITAFLKTKNHEESWRNLAFNDFLKPLVSYQLTQAGLGTLSEIFDGDSPHYPRGCVSQAWSVAEPLRAYVEDIILIRPPYEQKILHSE